MKVTNTFEMPWPVVEYGKIRKGETQGKEIADGSTPDGLNFAIAIYRFGKGEDMFETPRHHHTYEQVRIAIEGDYNFAPKRSIPEGWIAVRRSRNR